MRDLESVMSCLFFRVACDTGVVDRCSLKSSAAQLSATCVIIDHVLSFVEKVLYRVPMIPLFRYMYAPSEPDPTFFLNTDMWDL